MTTDQDVMRLLLKACTARVHCGDVANGTAFFVSPTELLTCAHVVIEGHSNQLFSEIGVHYRDGINWVVSPASATVSQTPLKSDLALLRLKQPRARGPYVCLSPQVSSRDVVSSFGYPTDLSDGDEMTFDYQGDSVKDGAPLFTLKTGQANPGASGSPVMNDRLRTVFGVLTWSRGGDIGGRVTPIQFALEEWPDLRQWQSIVREHNRPWYTMLPLSVWRAAEASERERLLREQLYLRDLSASHPLQFRWNSFIAKIPWHRRLEQRLVTLEAQAHSCSPSDYPPLRFPVLDYAATYDHIAASARPFITEIMPRWLLGLIRELDSKRQNSDSRARKARSPVEREAFLSEAHRLSEQIKHVVKVRDDSIVLKDAFEYLHFDRCFLILGNLGCGRTHFLTSRLSTPDNPPSENVFSLWLAAHQLTGNVGEVLLAAVSENTRVEWKSLRDFEAFLCAGSPGRMWVVTVDDIQSAPDLQLTLPRLHDFISRNTDLHSLRWAFALDHTAYGEVMTASALWRHYGFRSAENEFERTVARDAENGQIGNWMELDEINTLERTGIRLIERVVAEAGESSADVMANLARATLDVRKQLVRPFVAWLILDSRTEFLQQPPLDLHYVGFIREFWLKLLPRLGEDLVEQNRVEVCVGLLTSWLLNVGDIRPVYHTLAAHLVKESTGKSDLAQGQNVDSALAALENGGLLRRFAVENAEFDLVTHVEFLFDAFWHWRLGRRARSELNRELASDAEVTPFLDRWFSKKRLNPNLGSGMLQFLLLSLEDEPFKRDHSTTVEQIWHWAVSSDYAPKGAAWLAASKMGPQSHSWLVQALLQADSVPLIEGPELFAFVYFIASLSIRLPEGVQLDRVFGLLRPHYLALRDASLEDYFLYAIRRGLSGLDERDSVVQAMVPLDGCELLGVGEEAARMAMNALVAHESDRRKLVEGVLDFLIGVSQLDEHENAVRETGRHRFRTWVITLLCRGLLKSDELSAYELLSECSWYQAEVLGIRSSIGREMLREVNFAFADWYRAQSRKPRERYRRLVEQVAGSSLVAEREAAFFMIRHTRATNERIAVRVDSIFHPVLRRLSQDQDLGHIMVEYRGFLEANDIEDP